MVSCIIKGRLGNNGFIQMAAFVYALKHGLEYHCPYNTLAPHLWPNYFTHLSNPNWNPSLEKVYVNDDKHSYTELPFEEEWRDKNIIIGTEDINTGYFQSYLYVLGYEDKVREAFGFSGKTHEGEVGLHWRFGDFRLLPKHHPIVPDNYMHIALDLIKRKVFNINDYYCCSDEISSVRDFVFKYHRDNISNFTLSINRPPLTDFTELIFCEHAIVSNSSFSVLASILNPNPNKVIICPDESNYFGEMNKHLDVSTLYPENWLRIKY